VAHRRLFSALEAELGPFTPLARLEAWRLAALGVEFTLATRWRWRGGSGRRGAVADRVLA
jgi:hypothetical protein